MSLRMTRKPVSIDDFIDSKLFANMHGLTKRQLDYRLYLGQVEPMPQLFGVKYIFDPDAKIVIPPVIMSGGRPKGSTIENGAQRPGFKLKKAPRPPKAATPSE